MMPGPPNELQPMFTEQVIPRLAQLGFLLDSKAYVQLRTAGIGESMLETKLQPVFDRHAVGLASPLRSLVAASTAGSARRAAAREPLRAPAIAAECAASVLGEDLSRYGDDSLAKVCADLLRAQDKRLAVAETRTGGLLANAFTDIAAPRSSSRGGALLLERLQDAASGRARKPPPPAWRRERRGAVAMATGAAEKLGADYALSITGFAGPCGGANENPVGTIFVALHAPHGVWSRKLSFPGPRTTIKRRAVNSALDWLRRELVRGQNGATVPQRRQGVMQ